MSAETATVSVETRIAQAAKFMGERGIAGVYVSGNTEAKPFEEISFMRGPDEVGRIRFIEGKLGSEDTEEHERRLRIEGFVTEVIRPLERAAEAVIAEGSDLLDERFDPVLENSSL